MKRATIIFIALIPFVNYCAAQTWDEWFNQAKTQEKYLLAQIAKFELYLSYLKKGYSIAQAGLTLIGNIKKGDFDMHSAYFNSLYQVNPVVSKYAKIADIIGTEVNISIMYKKYYDQFVSSNVFSAAEISFIYSVFTNIISQTTTDLDELITVITSGQLQMKDDERLRKIDGIYTSISEKQSFMNTFCQKTSVEQLQKQHEVNDISVMQSLYAK